MGEAMRLRLGKPKNRTTAVEASTSSATSFDGALARELADPTPVEISMTDLLTSRPTNGPTIDFWAQYDQARAAADLFVVPPAAVMAVVGPLEIAIPVARKCRSRHWVGDGDVYVLSDRPNIGAEPDWTIVRKADDLLAVLEDSRHDSPLLVVDVPRELPPWVAELVTRLRLGGVGLVRYVLDGEPTDEALATWHGELGRPAVLDLASPIAPERVIGMLERGEPIASIAGVPITAELLLALHMEVFCE